MKATQRLECSDAATVVAEVTVRLINDSERARWNELIETEHYLKNSQLVGRQLRYVAEWNGIWVGLLGWNAPAYHLADRDEWIGWTIEQRLKRQKFIAQNSRFLLRVEAGQYPNLASRVLALCQRRLADDWINVYGYPVIFSESFTDPERFSGGCYRAAGWLKLGQTQGFRRTRRDFYQQDSRPKDLWVRPLHPKARQWLSGEQLPEQLRAHEDQPAYCPYTADDMRSLWEHFTLLHDPRTARGTRHPLPSVLSICTLATLCGLKGPEGIAEFARYRTQAQLRALRTHRNKKTGQYEPPSESTIRRVLETIDGDEFDRQIQGWMQARDPKPLRQLAVDGKTLKGTRRPDGKPTHLVSAISVDSRRVCAQRPVAEKSNEITAFIPMIKDLPLDGVIISGDAMQTQQDNAHFIVQEKGGEYFFSLKDNQPGIREKAERLFAGAFPPYSEPASGAVRQGTWPVGTSSGMGQDGPVG